MWGSPCAGADRPDFFCSRGRSLWHCPGLEQTFRAIFKPLFEVIRPVPPIAWVPLFTLWFGTSEFSRVAIITMGVFMPIVINSYSGVVMVPEINFQVGRVFGARSMDMLFDVVLPSSLNAIFAGIRTALGGGWMVLLASEMLGARRESASSSCRQQCQRSHPRHCGHGHDRALLAPCLHMDSTS